MIDADIKKEFSKAMSYQEIFMTATRLKKEGVDQFKVNKYLTKRKSELAKQASKVLHLKTTQLDTTLADSDNAVVYLNLEYIGNGNVIEYKDGKVILR
jgi:hypothetical protein